MNILLKEHFNKWYSLKAFYTAITIVDLPISITSCLLFTLITYFVTSQPLEMSRFLMFFAISLLVVLISQGTGLMIGAVCNVIVSMLLLNKHNQIMHIVYMWEIYKVSCNSFYNISSNKQNNVYIQVSVFKLYPYSIWSTLNS